MIPSLLTRTIEKLPPEVRLEGRILFLVDDPELVRRQLEGEDVELTDEVRSLLRDNISTDEITPAYICYYFDETLGEFPYLGLKAGSEFPIKQGSVKKGGFVASVSGKRRGKGSSREQSPYAEMMAGVRVVIAENIERIYRENCQNLGVLTSTNFELIDRIRSGETIPLTEFTEGADEITRGIIEHGGLFNYNVARLQGAVRTPPVSCHRRPPRHREPGRRGRAGAARERRGERPRARAGHGRGLRRGPVRRHLHLQRGQRQPGRPRRDAARRPPAHDHRREDLRPALGHRPVPGRDRRALGAARRLRLRADRHPLLARVRHADVGHLLRDAGRPGRAGAGARVDALLPRPPHLPQGRHAARARAARAAGRGQPAGGEAARVRREAGDHACTASCGRGTSRLRGHLPLQDPGELRASGARHHRLRLAHAARGRHRARWRSAWAPRPSSTPGSPRTCAWRCRGRSR